MLCVMVLQIFFARIPNTILEDELKEVFSQAGSVKEVVLFKTHASATINKVGTNLHLCLEIQGWECL